MMQIIEGFLDKGISIDINVAEKVKKYLRDITPKTENILNQLILETLEPKTLNIDSKLFKNVSIYVFSIEFFSIMMLIYKYVYFFLYI